MNEGKTKDGWRKYLGMRDQAPSTGYLLVYAELWRMEVRQGVLSFGGESITNYNEL
jgi:hypothetical protein